MTNGRKILLVLVVVIIVFRMLLPYIVLNYVNKKLANLTDYYGHVKDIDLSIYRGAYIIKDILLEKKENNDSVPFFSAKAIDLSVQWSAIFKGRVVGEIYVNDPIVNFVQGKHKDENVKQDTADFKNLVKDLMPLTINHFEINNGEIHYIDPNAKPKVDVAMTDLFVAANNLSNLTDKTKVLPSNIIARGNAYDGAFKMHADFDGLNKVPTFDMNAEVSKVNMVKLNDFMRAYGNFDVKKGTFGLYTEFAAKEGQFGGYVKPLLENMDIVQWNKEEGNTLQIFWETIVAGGASLFTNKRTGDLGTKIPINGKFDDPDINIWQAISHVLRNAFINALEPTLDNTISITTLEEEKKRTFFQKVLGKGKDDKDKKEEEKEKKR